MGRFNFQQRSDDLIMAHIFGDDYKFSFLKPYQRHIQIKSCWMDWAELFIKTNVYPKLSKVYVIHRPYRQQFVYSRAGCIWFAGYIGAKSVVFDEINNVARLVWYE